MPESLTDHFQRLHEAVPADDEYIPSTVSTMLRAARAAQATDIHLTPHQDGLRMQWRIDGVLHDVGEFSAVDAPRIVARLKVLAELLTYRTDVPQEGRIVEAGGEETRVSSMPTLFGEKAVVRLFAPAARLEWLEQLGLPAEIEQSVARLAQETSGVLLFTGPAGSGKTTTLYACLRQIARESRGMRSLVSIEDPVEVVVPGVAQSQVDARADFDLHTALRAMMRQDPEVIMVGEIRDARTAEAVFQAALTGHLVLTSFHAGSAAGAISRLLDMGIEPYLLRSAVRAVVSQRLLRRLCTCSEPELANDETIPAGARRAVGCSECQSTGYSRRFLIAEMLRTDAGPAARAILSREDTDTLETRALEAGMKTQWSSAWAAVATGHTSAAEVYRTMGGLREAARGEERHLG